MKIAAIIPARMGSSRFPGKPLAPLLGRTMIEHVARRVALCTSLDAVYVATCDREIFAAVEAFGGKAVMTSDRHERASDRAAEAILGLDADIAVMIQGDEPMTVPQMIDEAVAGIVKDASIASVNLTKRIASRAEFEDPNTIKVLMDNDWNALYMTRQPVPTCPRGDFSAIAAYKQVCVMPFRRDALLRFAALAPTPLEIAESIDMNRYLQHGVRVRMVETGFDTHAVDTPADLALVEQSMRNDPLLGSY